MRGCGERFMGFYNTPSRRKGRMHIGLKNTRGVDGPVLVPNIRMWFIAWLR